MIPLKILLLVDCHAFCSNDIIVMPYVSLFILSVIPLQESERRRGNGSETFILNNQVMSLERNSGLITRTTDNMIYNAMLPKLAYEMR